MKKDVFLRKLACFGLIPVLLVVLILSACSSSSPTATSSTNLPTTTKPSPTQVAATSTTPSNTPKYGGTLKIGFNRDAVYLGDPVEIRQQQDCAICRPAIEALARYDNQGKLVPFLATEWQTDPQTLTMTIKLRKGVKFHDGTDFNAEAVKFNLDRFKDSTRSELKNVKSVDVVDDSTVKLNLGSWDSTIEGAVLVLAGNIISPTAFQKNGKEWCEKNPVGTGPFKFVVWERDVVIKYEKNTNYWRKDLPYLDAIEFHIIADPMVSLAAFQRGEVDVLERVAPKDIDTLKATGKYLIVDLVWAGLGLEILVPDSNHPDSPFSKLKVRQAVAYAIDKKAIIDSILMGHGKVATQYADPNSWAYNPDVKGFQYDPAKAKQLLTEAGYPNGFECTLYAKTVAPYSQCITAIQGFLSKVGINGKVDLLNETRFNEVSGQKGWSNALNFLSLRGAPDYALQIPRYFGTKAYVSWISTVIHPDDAMKAIEEAVTAKTFEVKQAAMFKIQKSLFEENIVAIPMHHEFQCLAKYPDLYNDNMYIADGNIWTPETAWKK